MTSQTSPHEVPSFSVLREQFLQSMRLRGCSEQTVKVWSGNLGRFLTWCCERGAECASDTTPQLLAAYRRHLFHHRKVKTGEPLKFSTQLSYLTPVVRWCVWLHENGWVEQDPTIRFEMPKEERRLPRGVMTADQMETVLNGADLNTPTGLRNRAMMEVLYSTGVRAGELVKLQVYDVELERQVVRVNSGKGNKDRVVPIGQRALSWLRKYTDDIRPLWVERTDESALFISIRGQAFCRNNASAIVKRYLLAAGITARGSCHLFRHTAATLMLEGGADLRSLQDFLGHERLVTTQIYTHVSIQRLKEVHTKTHPARPLDEK